MLLEVVLCFFEMVLDDVIPVLLCFIVEVTSNSYANNSIQQANQGKQ